MESDRCRSPSHRSLGLSSAPLCLPSIWDLNEATDLHIALFIVAIGNTAVTQLSEATIWGAGLKPTINGSARANNSQVIWIQLLWIERKCGLTDSPANYIEWKKNSAAKPYCIDYKRMFGTGIVLRELKDLIWCCLRFTKEFVFCTEQIITKPVIF